MRIFFSRGGNFVVCRCLMGRITEWERPVPRYPVIDPNPTPSKVWSSLDLSEYGRIVLLTSIGCIIGLTSGRWLFALRTQSCVDNKIKLQEQQEQVVYSWEGFPVFGALQRGLICPLETNSEG